MNGINGIALSILTTGELALESKVLKKSCLRVGGVREAGRGEWGGGEALESSSLPPHLCP